MERTNPFATMFARRRQKCGCQRMRFNRSGLQEIRTDGPTVRLLCKTKERQTSAVSALKHSETAEEKLYGPTVRLKVACNRALFERYPRLRRRDTRD